MSEPLQFTVSVSGENLFAAVRAWLEDRIRCQYNRSMVLSSEYMQDDAYNCTVTITDQSPETK